MRSGPTSSQRCGRRPAVFHYSPPRSAYYPSDDYQYYPRRDGYRGPSCRESAAARARQVHRDDDCTAQHRHAAASAAEAVERARPPPSGDAGRIGDLLDVLRTARLWLPLPDDGARRSTARRSPCRSSPTSAATLCPRIPRLSCCGSSRCRARRRDRRHRGAACRVCRPPIWRGCCRLRSGSRSTPAPARACPSTRRASSYLAARRGRRPPGSMSVGPLPVRPDGLLAGIAAGLLGDPRGRAASRQPGCRSSSRARACSSP